jgi:hypothetical protein
MKSSQHAAVPVEGLHETAIAENLIEDAHDSSRHRQGRIAEYQRASELREDPYAAMIGASTADLQEIQDYYGSVILRELNRQPPDLDAIRRLAPDIKLLLKLRDAIEFDHKLVHELQLAESAEREAPVHYAGHRKGRAAGLIPKQWKV